MIATKPSIKSITIKKFLILGFIFLFSMILLIAINFRSLIESSMIDKGHTLALSIESALTSHMLTGNYKNKRNIIDQAALLPGIDNLKIILFFITKIFKKF